MSFEFLLQTLGNQRNPVILLEDTREVSEHDIGALTNFAANLARALPDAIFRSGNAGGSDEAFARGVARIDASRLELVLPAAGHRRAARPVGARCLSMENLSPQTLENLDRQTVGATPGYQFLLDSRAKNPKLRVKLSYLLRDALKVTGASEAQFAPATVGIFFVNPKTPNTGGTAHTIRVCDQNGVPVFKQSEWLEWKFNS